MPRLIGSQQVARTADALESAGARLSALLRQVQDTGRPAVGRWTVGETAAHVAVGPQYLHDLATGQAQPSRLDDVDADNERALAEERERDPRVLADRLDAGLRALVGLARSLPDDPATEPFTGIRVPFSAVLALELAEVLVHGRDIARAAQLPWRIGTGEALWALDGLTVYLPFALDARRARGVRLRVDVRIRGLARQILTIEEGRLTVDPVPAGPVDCHLAADPVDYLLVMFHRIGPWQPLLRGRLWIWGRRPWTAARLPSLVHT